jgi:hypothetical protein
VPSACSIEEAITVTAAKDLLSQLLLREQFYIGQGRDSVAENSNK